MKERNSLLMVAMKTGKTYFSSYHRNGCLEEKFFIKNMNFVESTITEKLN